MRATVEAGLVKKMLVAMGEPAIEVKLWDGQEVAVTQTPPVARIGFADRSALLRLLGDPQLQFGELYTAGKITIDGDPERLLEEVYGHARRPPSAAPRRLKKWIGRARPNTRLVARRNARRHYDLGNEFYQLWLDESLTYSCAYFSSPSLSLNQAQVAKMDHIARKLRVQPGQSVVEIGSGWGGMALHLARNYGAQVTAFNVSREQLDYSRKRVAAEGLSGKVEFIEDDYRNITGTYDAAVSVGMLEHVGVGHYREYGEMLLRCLKPSGIGLVQSIGRSRPEPVNPWIARHIFPGGYVPALREMMEIFETADFSVLDVENLRLHYARTLESWRERFEAAREKVAKMFDESFVRMWRLYLAGSAAAFRAGDMQLFQVLFAPRGNNAVPMTRAHLY